MLEALLSPYHEIIYNEWKINKNRSDYNIVFDQNIKGQLQVARLRQSIIRFIDDYLIFNSHIKKNIKRELCWKKNSKIEKIDFLVNKESKMISNKQLLDYISAPFNLEAGPLYRFALIKNEEYDYRLIIVLHHIIIDRNLFDNFIDELSKYYNNQNYKSLLSLEEQVTYLNKLSKEQKEKIELNKERLTKFWNERLSESESIDFFFLKCNNYIQDNQLYTDLTDTDKCLPLQELANIGEIRFNFSKGIFSQLSILKEKFNLSPYWYGQVIYALLLNKYTGQNNFCIAYPVSMNQKKSFIFGNQINTVVIPYSFDCIKTAQELIKYIVQVKDLVNKENAKGLKNNIFPIYNITKIPSKTILSSPFFQTNLRDKKLCFSNLDISVNNSSIDLVDNITFKQVIVNKKLSYRINYNLSYFNKILVQDFVESYKRLFIEILNDLVELKFYEYNANFELLNSSLKKYSLLSDEQYHKIINEWNDTDKDYPRDKTIHELFEEQVEKTPDAIAVVCEDIKLTYKELNEKANQLAHYLVKQKIPQETIIAVYYDKSIDLVISLIAILKTGCIYLPLDVKLPTDRLQFILNDANVLYVITNLEYQDRFGEYRSNIIKLDDNKINFFSELRELDNLNISVSQAQGVYITYTSGTTGFPKGITNTVQGLMNRLLWTIDNYAIDSKDSLLPLASIGFDISVWEILFPLLKGASISVLDEEKCKDIDQIIDVIKKDKITILHFVPSLLRIFLNHFRSKDCISIRKVVCGGEHLESSLKKKFFDIFPNQDLYHAYGPTEASISVTHWNCRDNKFYDKVPIGKPISNTKIYIVSDENIPLPVGAIGELCIGGICLAKGYLNLPELTDEHFITNPFQTEAEKADKSYGGNGKNARLYKTGDLVRWLPDGNIEYVGRSDFQIKIRGNRIELGEIESVLCSYEGIKQAVVVAKENTTGNKKLIAYLVNNFIDNISNNKPRLWPSIAEYFVYDELVYDILTNDLLRNNYYKSVIRRYVSDKVVLDIGTGKDAILARICIEAGARKVYAVEYLEKSFNQARETLKKLGLEDKIILIYGNSIKITLPEKVDLVVSEIVGPIGSMEGAVNILNDARERHLKPFGIMIPRISNTYIAAVNFPNSLANNYFEPIPKSYVSKIFENSGYCFDLRVGIENFPTKNIMSSSAIFEHLDFNSFVELESSKQVTLSILRDGYIDGFLLWLNLEIDIDISIDTLEEKTCWIPIYFPVFEEKIYVKEHDIIYLKCSRGLSENKLNPDYYIEGKISRVEADDVLFNYASKHYNKIYKGNKFYQDLFSHMNHGDVSKTFNEINFKESLQIYLRDRLPDYMIPNVFINVDKLPLTINGKLDRKALPDPETMNDDKNYVIPRNELEERLCSIWEELLNLPNGSVGIEDDFFRLGGDSIVSIQLVSRLKQRLGINLSIKDVFSYRSIAKLYDNVIVKEQKTEIITEQGILSGELPLLPIQKLFFSSNFRVPHHWNQSFLVKVPLLDVKRLKDSITKLVLHHDSFRLRYFKDENDNDKYIQYYDKDVIIEDLKILDIRDLKKEHIRENLGVREKGEIAEGSEIRETMDLNGCFDNKLDKIFTEWQSEFNLENGPLYRIGYIYGYEDQSARIYFALHHLLVDTVSWRILVEDLESLYKGNELGLKGSSYRQWSRAINRYNNDNCNELYYWQEVMQDYDGNKALERLVKEGTRCCSNLELDQSTTDLLLRESNRAYNTEINDILLIAFGYALFMVTGDRINHIILEGHGREEIDNCIDITRTVGWFTMMYPVRLVISEDIGNSLIEVKESLRKIPNRGIGYGALLGYKLEDLPRISFNYLGRFDQNEKSNDVSWYISDESSGISIDSKNINSNIIDINGRIIEGKLEFRISTKLDQITTNKLAENFKKKLEQIIIYGIKNSRDTKYTISDLVNFIPYFIYNEQKYINRTLFIIPPGEGGAESYINTLVPKFKNTRLVLFNNIILEMEKQFGNYSVKNFTFESIAKKYLEYIKSIQPTGPYNIFGWSFGGVVAFEIARQLEIKGSKVANVFILDSYFCYKNVMKKLNISFFKDNIYYIYEPVAYKTKFNITLFKANKSITKLFSETDNIAKDLLLQISYYYVKKSKYNYLDHIVNNSLIELVTLDVDHYSIIQNNTFLSYLSQWDNKYYTK